MCSQHSVRQKEIPQQQAELTDFEKQLINCYQGDFPLTSEPFQVIAERLNSTSEKVQEAIKHLLERGVLTRFGPLYNIEKVDGVFSLCALKVPSQRFEEVTELVNSYTEVAHNYQRDYEWNMWFVLAAESEHSLIEVFAQISKASGCPSLNLPKQTEFFVGLKFEV